MNISRPIVRVHINCHVTCHAYCNQKTAPLSRAVHHSGLNMKLFYAFTIRNTLCVSGVFYG